MVRKILPVLIGSLLLLSSAGAQTQNIPKSLLYYKKGIEMKDKNMFPEAMEAFRMAISLNKKFDSAYLELVGLDMRFEKTDSAIVCLRNAIAANPKMVIAHIALGKIYRDIKPNFDSALIYFSNAAQIDSLNKETINNIAWCYNAKKEYVNAIPYAIRAIAIDSLYRPAYGELAHAYRYSKNYTGCIEQFKKYFTITPPIDLPYFYCGMCYTELNEKENALKMYDELMKINPKMAGSLKKKIDMMK
jgi:tetratricopeptide (TPR) repeat protein